MRRTKRRSGHTIYRQRGGDGWTLAVVQNLDFDSNTADVVLYHIGGGDTWVETERTHHSASYDGIDRVLRRKCGAKLGPYEGAKPEANTPLEDQPRAVRMQRHAIHLYDALGHVRGLSETLAVKAAQKFGSKWSEKDSVEDWKRIKGIGEGRASRLAEGVRTSSHSQDAP